MVIRIGTGTVNFVIMSIKLVEPHETRQTQRQAGAHTVDCSVHVCKILQFAVNTRT